MYLLRELHSVELFPSKADDIKFVLQISRPYSTVDFHGGELAKVTGKPKKEAQIEPVETGAIRGRPRYDVSSHCPFCVT